MNAERFARLLQLASPALPVGAYSYSGGLEAAVEAGIVRDAASAERWIGEVLEHCVARMEAPLLLRLLHAFANGTPPGAWNDLFLASRESAELRAETLQMGYSLARLLADLGEGDCGVEQPAYPTAFAFAAVRWHIDPEAALAGYLWSWLENQVAAAVKCVPLGQTDAQRILHALGGRLAAFAERAARLGDDELANFAPRLALLSARHETQYSRLFRS